jgi:hypothetical protein
MCLHEDQNKEYFYIKLAFFTHLYLAVVLWQFAKWQISDVVLLPIILMVFTI